MKKNMPSKAVTSLAVLMVLFIATTMFAQQFSEPRSGDETTAKLVCEMVQKYHISQKRIDDDISQRLLNRYVEQLDPQKLYFFEGDIRELERQKTELDDQLRRGEVTFGFTTFDLYFKRLEQRMTLVHKLIDSEFDYTKDESLVLDGEDLPWAKTADEVNDRWRKRVKYELLDLKLDDNSLKDARDRLHRRYRNIHENAKQTEKSEILELYLSAVTHCFDPHSSYMSPETLEDFRISMALKLEGIGAALRSEDGHTVVARVVPGGAADKDGRLTVGDKIIGVAQDGEENFVDLVEMKLTRVVRLIRGKKGTKVRLQVKKEKTGDIQVYELTRQTIELKSSEVKGEIIETNKRLEGGRAARIGVINIPSFYRDFNGARLNLPDFKSTARDLQKVYNQFQQQGGVDAIVVDLRLNGGGALVEATEVTGMFLDRGPVVQVKDQDGQVEMHNDEDAGAVFKEPVVVICNRLSASASEIFAGAIKDYQRGIIVGDVSTHGKGTVQNVMPVNRQLFQFLRPDNRGALKLTINQFYRVNGASTQNEGVFSDVVLPSLFEHMELGEKHLDNALAFDRIKPARYNAVGMTSPDIISALQKKSQARVVQDDGFKEDLADIRKYNEKKNRKLITLNEEKLRQEREQDEKNKDDDDKKDDKDDDGPIFPEGHYNDEVLRITLDYLDALRHAKTAGR